MNQIFAHVNAYNLLNISRNSLCYMLTVIVGKKYYGHMSYDNNCEKMACVKHVKQNS